MEALNVFVSSTWLDMVPERQAVELATARLRSLRFVGMEHFGARDGSTRAVSLEEVDRCRIYVGVIGPRWGSGITADEYRRARELRLPCLLYFKDGAVADDARVAAWKAELAATHTVVRFSSPEELAARLVADLHNLVLEQVAGRDGGGLSLEYRTRIEAFVAEYLGRADAPVAFGGRDTEIGALDRWLEDADAPPYAMLAGPAGRGKSALLIRWVRRLALAPGLAVLFFPISIRFRTNLATIAFTSIASRLAALHGEPLRAGADTPVEVWRELMAGLLRRPLPDGRHLLLVLDGADEAADWTPGPDLFPAAPAERLRVLVSARYQPGDTDARGWVARLGWQRAGLAWPIDLGPLSAAGLTDVLRQASVPLELLSGRADVVAELFRLSRGDPLLIQLYVADLLRRGDEAARLRPEDLARREPGLAGYFAAWWEDQRVLWGADSPLREAEFGQVFNVLSCALGPLRGRDLMELLSAERPLGTWVVDDVMRSLRRFVVGDGDSQGWAFSHPRLAEYFYEELERQGEAGAVEQRFVRWGRRWQDDLAAGRREPEDVPDYLLQFLRPHLLRSGCGVEDLAALADVGWVRAWERLDKGSWSGFLVDLHSAREAARVEDDRRVAEGLPPPHLGLELRSAVFVASIAAGAGDMPAALLSALLARRLWSIEQAIAYATRVPGAQSRLETLLTVVAAASDADRPLALAAALGEVRHALAGDKSALRTGLRRLAESDPGPAGRPLAAAQLAAAARLVRQGLDDEQANALADAVLHALAYGNTSPGRRILAIDAVSDVLARPELATLRREALTRLGQSVAAGGGEEPRLALSLLGPLAGDEPSFAMPALAAALMAAGEAIADGKAIDDTVCRALAEGLPVCGAVIGRAMDQSLARAAKAPGFDRLLDALSSRADRCLLETLESLLAQVPVSRRPAVAQACARVATALAAAQAENPGAPARPADEWSGFPDLPAWLGALDEPAALAWLALAAPVRAEAAAVASSYEWLLEAAYAHEGPAWRRTVALRALELAAFVTGPALADAVTGVAVLAALVDHLQADGSGDAFAPWRAPAATRLAEAIGLQRTVHSLLARGALGREALQSALQTLGGGMPAGSAPAAESPPAAALELAKRHRTEPLDAGEAAQRALDAAGSLPAALGLLREAMPSLGRALVAQAAGALFDLDREIRPETLLLGEGVERPALDDVLNDALLLRALAHPPPADADRRVWATLPLRVAQLGAPTDELVAQVITTLAKGDAGLDEMRVTAWTALAPVVRPALQARFLEAAARVGEPIFTDALNALWRHAPDRAAFDSEVPALAARLVSPQARGQAFEEALVRAGDRIDTDAALALARSLPGARLEALLRLLPVLPAQREVQVLQEALALCAAGGGSASQAATLVSRAVVRAAADATLIPAAVRVAVAMSGREARGRALAQLADHLGDEALADAVTASLRIEDATHRMRAMRDFVVRGGAAAAEVALRSVQALSAGPVQQGARLYMAGLVARPARWDWAAGAIDAVEEPHSGFEPVEVVDALAEALVDAPSALQAQAVERLRRASARARSNRVGASGQQDGKVAAACTRALESWMPTLAPAWRPPALVQIAGWPAPESAARIGALWTSRAITAARGSTAVPAEARDLLDQAADRHACPTTERMPSRDEPLEGAASADDDLSLASQLARLAAVDAPTPYQRLAMAALARRIGDPVLREQATRRLAVHAGDAWIARTARAAEALQALQPPAEAARQLVRLARRQPPRQRERTLDAAEACVRGEPEAARRADGAVEIALASPLRARALLEETLVTVHAEERAAALARLLAGVGDADAADALAAAASALPQERLVVLLRDVAQQRSFGPVASKALLELARGAHHDAWRGTLLALAAGGLEGDGEAAWELASTITVDHAWLEAALALVQRWPASLSVPRAATAASHLAGLNDAAATLRGLCALAPAWPAGAWDACVAPLRAFRDETMRTTALVRLFDTAAGGPAPAPLLEQARALADPRLRCIAIGRAARRGADERLLEEALREGDRSQHATLRLQAWTAVASGAPPLPDRLWDRLLDEFAIAPAAALQAAARVADALTPQQAAAMLDACRGRTLRIGPGDRADAYAALLPRLAPTERARALLDLPAHCPGPATARCLAGLGDAIAGDACEEAALEAAQALRGPSMAAAAVLGLVERLAPVRQVRALEWLASTPSAVERARRLAAVRPALHPDALASWQAHADAFADPVLARSLQAVAAPAGGTAREADVDPIDADDAIADLLNELPVGPAGADPPAAQGWIGASARGLEALVDRVRRIEPECDRIEQVRRSLPTLTVSERVRLLHQLPRLLGPDLAENTACDVAATLPPEQLADFMAETADLTDGAVFQTRLRRVPGLQHEIYRGPWLAALRKALDAAAQEHDRAGLLSTLRRWAPVIASLAGEHCALEVTQALADAGELWP